MEKIEFKTEQEAFWAGQFGDEYIKRNQGENCLTADLALLSKALTRTSRIDSCIELGANIGLNLQALKLLYPEQIQYAVEINQTAIQELHKFIPRSNVIETSIFDFDPSSLRIKCDLVLIKGVLIHINPKFLANVYEKIYESSQRYILLCEYYNPKPVVVEYRGHSEQLFKRDFAGEMMDLYPDLTLIDYGFKYHRDPNFPLDDVTWFLMEKTN
jgi:pseudaminic acid biosynthesis-associated methylase